MAEVKKHPVAVFLDNRRDEFAAALQKTNVSFGAFSAAAVADCLKEPKLLQTLKEAPETFDQAMRVSATLGLLPGGDYDEFYLIPRRSSKRNRLECTFIVGYKGLCKMAYRHPRVHTVEAFCVFEGEPFEWDRASGVIRHPFTIGIDRSPDRIVAAYSVVYLTTPADHTVVASRPLIWVLERDQILKRRAQSESFRRDMEKLERNQNHQCTSPWILHFEPMARKTVLLSAFNGGSIPKASEMDRLLQAAWKAEGSDEEAEEWVDQDLEPEGPGGPPVKDPARRLRVRVGDLGRGAAILEEFRANVPDPEEADRAARARLLEILSSETDEDLEGLTVDEMASLLDNL